MLATWWAWITDLGNSKIVSLLIFFFTFISIVLYVYTNKARSERLESYRYLPLMDDDAPKPPPQQASPKRDEK